MPRRKPRGGYKRGAKVWFQRKWEMRITRIEGKIAICTSPMTGNRLFRIAKSELWVSPTRPK